MTRALLPALRLFVVLSLLTGLAYPWVVTGLASAAFPDRAEGSLLRRDGRVVGSALVGQPFASPRFFWGRPASTTPPYDAAAAAGSNLGPTSPALADAVRARLETLRAADPDNPAPVPMDLVAASGSGLDPHISPEAARWQVGRVARARGVAEARVARLVEAAVVGRTFGLLGEPRVNVLELNLALEALR